MGQLRLLEQHCCSGTLLLAQLLDSFIVLCLLFVLRSLRTFQLCHNAGYSLSFVRKVCTIMMDTSNLPLALETALHQLQKVRSQTSFPGTHQLVLFEDRSPRDCCLSVESSRFVEDGRSWSCAAQGRPEGRLESSEVRCFCCLSCTAHSCWVPENTDSKLQMLGPL